MQNLQQKGLPSKDRPRRCPTLMRQDGRARNTDVWTFVSFGAYAAQDTAEIVRHRARPGQSTARLRSTVASTADLATTLHFLWANRLAELARHIGQGSSWWAETPCRLYQVLCVYDSRRTMTVTAGHDDKCIVAREIQAGHHDCHRCKLTPKTSSSIGPRRGGKPIKHPCRVPGVFGALGPGPLAHPAHTHDSIVHPHDEPCSVADPGYLGRRASPFTALVRMPALSLVPLSPSCTTSATAWVKAPKQ